MPIKDYTDNQVRSSQQGVETGNLLTHSLNESQSCTTLQALTRNEVVFNAVHMLCSSDIAVNATSVQGGSR